MNVASGIANSVVEFGRKGHGSTVKVSLLTNLWFQNGWKLNLNRDNLKKSPNVGFAPVSS